MLCNLHKPFEGQRFFLTLSVVFSIIMVQIQNICNSQMTPLCECIGYVKQKLAMVFFHCMRKPSKSFQAFLWSSSSKGSRTGIYTIRGIVQRDIAEGKNHVEAWQTGQPTTTKKVYP